MLKVEDAMGSNDYIYAPKLGEWGIRAKVNTDLDMSFITIQKVASSSMSQCLRMAGWGEEWCDDYVPQSRNFVLIRNPIDRWVSGMTHHCFYKVG